MGLPRKKQKKTSAKNSPPKATFPTLALEKQMLSDFSHRISLHVGNFLVLTEEGDPTQIALAHQKAKSEFLKFGPEMYKLANQMGGVFPNIVEDFLLSIDAVLHATPDDEKVSHCFRSTQKLESELKQGRSGIANRNPF
jgi:hypothetical protein